jgi:hypothetical protein
MDYFILCLLAALVFGHIDQSKKLKTILESVQKNKSTGE